MTQNYQKEPIVLALGFFDGVHKGHQKLITTAKQSAEELGIKSGVMSFKVHPLTEVFPRYTPALLMDNETKIKKIKSFGIDHVFLEDFSEDLMKLEPEAFIRDFLVKKFNVKKVIVGFNYTFGYKGKGTVSDLIKLGKKYGFEVEVIEPCIQKEKVISSTHIRELISQGKIKKANNLLGSPFKLTGKIVKGKELGRKYNIPTANLEVDQKSVIPKSGVYYTKMLIDGKKYDGLTNLGHNPTFKDHPYSVETYLYDFDDDIYGKEVELEFYDFVRNEKKFPSIEALFKRIKYDIDLIDQKYRKSEEKMAYKTTEEQEELRQKVRKFAEEKVKPIAFQLDKNNEFPVEIVEEMKELGLMGLPYPEEYGGAGKDVDSYAIAVEELSRVDGGTGVILSAHVSLGSYPIFAYGTEEQKQKYLKPLASGEKLGAFGLTEPNAGSDASGTETTAVDKGDHYLLNGEKIFITNAPIADTYVVFASTDPSKGTRGISAFIVEKGWDGFTFSDHYDKMGIRSSSTAELHFKDVKVPKENLLGKEGEGFKIAMQTLDGGRIGIASQALGIAQGAYEAALEYAKEREQFGQPIGAQQAVAFKLADMATKLRAARFLVYSAAELKENHEPYSMEAAMAKMYASDICLEVVNDAMQIFGGSGFMKGMDVERAYRDAKITTIYEGTNEIQRVVIASNLLGKLKKNEPKAKAAPTKKPRTKNELRKKQIFNSKTAGENVTALVEALKNDGYAFDTVDIEEVNQDIPISQADRVVAIGKGIGEIDNVKLAEDLVKATGATLGSSRPVAESLKYVPIDRFVGLSGQKFGGDLYFALGISGAIQHLKGIEDATTVVAINNDPNAAIFDNVDYGIVGDIEEVVPLLTEALKNS